MALRWIEGFETWGNLTDERDVWGDIFYGKYGSSYCEDGTPKLVEGYRGIGLGLSFNNVISNHLRIPLDNQPTWTVGVAFYIPGSVYYFGEDVLRLQDSGSSQLRIQLLRDMGSGTHEIILLRGSTQIDSLGFYAPSQWLYIELQAMIHNSDGSYECRVRGTHVCSDTGVDTAATSNDYANMVRFGQTNGYVDDIYVLDGTSPGLDDFLGEVKVDKGVPTSDYSVQWARSGGANNYSNVDEVPVSEGDYIYSKTTNDVDLFGVAPVSSVNVLGAQLTVDTMLSTSGGKELILVCDSVGNQQTESHQIGATDERVAQCLVTDIDPNTSAAWTQTNINAARWGVKVG